MKYVNLAEELRGNTYPGRGIVLGRSEDGKKAVIAYFIMGRSENSRNRVFVEQEGGIRTEAFDPAKLEDPSLIIYAPVRVLGKQTVVTNGDQTDTIYDFLKEGKSFEEALRTRTFEPDAPNFTPRISGLVEGLITNSRFSRATTMILPAHADTSLNTPIQKQEKVTLSIHTNVMAARSHPTKESQLQL